MIIINRFTIKKILHAKYSDFYTFVHSQWHFSSKVSYSATQPQIANNKPISLNSSKYAILSVSPFKWSMKSKQL